MFVISRFEHYKFSSAVAVFAESERKLARYDNPDYRPEKTVENVYLERPFLTADLETYILDRAAEFKCRMSTNPELPVEKQTNVMSQCLYTASAEFFEGMSRDEIVDYFKHCFKFFRIWFPSVEVLSAVVHFDEVTPHLHISFLPLISKVNSRGKLKTVFSTSELFKGKDFFTNYQNEFYAYMDRLYPYKQIDRKGDVEHDHLTVQEFKAKQREIEKLEKTIDELNAEADELEAYIEEVKAEPSLSLKIENADLRRQLSYYERVCEYLLKKFPQLKPIFDYFRSSRSAERDL